MSFKKIYSLLILRNRDEILLGYKKRGFGKDKWNGFGGKVEENETVQEGAIREMKEESGVDVNPDNVEKVGILDFIFTGESKVMKVHIFQSLHFSGIPTESEEMKPKWFKIEDLPYDFMWPDDRIWYPLLLNGQKFKGEVNFKGEQMLSHTIHSVDFL